MGTQVWRRSMGVWQTIHKNERHKKRKLYLFTFYTPPSIHPSTPIQTIFLSLPSYGIYADTHRDAKHKIYPTTCDIAGTYCVPLENGMDKKLCEKFTKRQTYGCCCRTGGSGGRRRHSVDVRVAVKYMHIHYPYVFNPKKQWKEGRKKTFNRTKDKMQEHQHLGVSENVSKCHFSFSCGARSVVRLHHLLRLKLSTQEMSTYQHTETDSIGV